METPSVDVAGANRTTFESFDDTLLQQALADAGRWAYGTVLVEFWVWDDERTLLSRAGYFADPVFHNRTQCREVRDDLPSSKCCPICRLTDPNRSDFLPPVPLSAGVGLPGVLWSSGRRSWRGSHNSQSRRNRHRIESTTPVVFPDSSPSNAATTGTPLHNRNVAWREIKAIVDDPDQPWNPRLQLLGTMGLGWVAAVDFDKLGHLGIVVYMAREGVDLNRLQCESNEEYLMAASDFAAAAYALRSPRRRVVEERRYELRRTLQRVKNRILELHRMGVSFEQLCQGSKGTATDTTSGTPNTRTTALCGERISSKVQAGRKRMATTIIKALGANVQPPPVMGWKQSLLTFLGCFLTLLTLTRLNVLVSARLGSDFAIPLPPFGALMTLLYGLTAAPASQPRNAILGQTVSIAIAMGISRLSTLSIWFRQTLATSLAIGAMVKMGVTHPPAGAAAMLFATGKYGWGNLLYVLIGTIIAVLYATIINNSSDKRHYPTFWGLGVPLATFQAIKWTETV